MKLKDILILLRIYRHLPNILVSIVDRLEQLEERLVPQEYTIKLLNVPFGMSTEVAWSEYKEKGRQYGHESSRKERVLVDTEENLLAILR